MFQAMRLSGLARSKTSIGEIVNLMSVDAQKVIDKNIKTTRGYEF